MAYTSGEIAKRCHVSVRTVQYYDTRGILRPSGFSEGGRRLYDDEDIKRLKIICLLRELDMPIAKIQELFSRENPEDLIYLLLEEQENQLTNEISEKKAMVQNIHALRASLKTMDEFSSENFDDILRLLEGRSKTSRIYRKILMIGLGLNAVELAGFLMSRKTGKWSYFGTTIVLDIVAGLLVTKHYYKELEYICPNCHAHFMPSFREFFFAPHTMRTRKLSCPVCGTSNYCAETVSMKEN